MSEKEREIEERIRKTLSAGTIYHSPFLSGEKGDGPRYTRFLLSLENVGPKIDYEEGKERRVKAEACKSVDEIEVLKALKKVKCGMSH